MRKLAKSLCSIALASVVILSGIPAYTGMQVAKADSTATASEYGLADNVQEGIILHCWNWSYNAIADNMEKIAELGYTSVQTSPVQQSKTITKGTAVNGNWYWLYQPINFSIDDSGNSALGTKAEFEAMCTKAHEYGIKVIVDVVANHLASGSSCTPYSTCMADLKDDPTCWHKAVSLTDYNKRYDLTQYCSGNLPDLNTASTKVQNYTISLMKECIDCGADGFRFDSAKHIETPYDDESFASNFWPKVINAANTYALSKKGIELFNYGEVLGNPYTPIKNYTEFIGVTDTGYGGCVRNDILQSNGSMIPFEDISYYPDTNFGKYPITWAESHDTWANLSDGTTRNVDEKVINRTWAIVAAGAEQTPLYFARPKSITQTKMGDADATGWTYSEVAAVNKFHNHFIGTDQNKSSLGNDTVFIERGKAGKDAGVVVVNCAGKSCDIEQKVTLMTDGFYKDQISGNVFTVKDGMLQGKIGDTGIAVVYNANASEGLSIASFLASKKSGKVLPKTNIKLSANASGENVQYKFTAKLGSTTTTIKDFNSSSSATWKPSKAGTYTLKVTVKGSLGTLTKSMKFVVKAPLSVSSLKSGSKNNTSKVGKKVTVTAKTSGGIGSVKYKFTYTYLGKETKIKDYSSSKSVSFVPKKKGTYKVKAYVKDSTEKEVSKTLTYKVTK